MTVRDDIFDRPNAYENADGRAVYRASSLGNCTRSLVYARMGMTASAPPDFMLAKYQEGVDHETAILRDALGEDYTIITERKGLELYGKVVEADGGLQVEVEVECGKRAVVRCHPDAIVVSKTTLQPYVVEVKFLGPSMFADYHRHGIGFKAAYEWQFAVEMLGTGLPGIYVVAEKLPDGDDGGVKVGKILARVQEEPPRSLIDIKTRVWEIEGHVNRGTLPDCPSPYDWPCGFWQEHDEKAEIEVLDDDVLQVLVGSLITDTYQKGVIDGWISEARVKIRERLTNLGKTTGKVQTGMGSAKVSIIPARPGNVSWAKYADLAKTMHPDLEDNIDVEKLRGKDVEETVKVEIEKPKEAEA